MVKLRISRWRDYPGHLGESDAITGVLIRRRLQSYSQRKDVNDNRRKGWTHDLWRRRKSYEPRNSGAFKKLRF